MNKEDIDELKEIVQQAKRLEELILEIEGPLTDWQEKNLAHEFFCIGAPSVRPLADVVSRIEDALHHHEEPEKESILNWDAAIVYEGLCSLRDQWNALFTKKRVDGQLVYAIFSQWTNLIYRYTEYIGNKYGLIPSSFKIGSKAMKCLGSCGGSSIKFNRRLIKDCGHAMTTAIHELCHIRHFDHSTRFWQLYEDICLNEGILLERVLGNKRSFRSIHEPIPYRWDTGIDFFSDRESNAIQKHMRRCKSFRKTLENKTKES